MFNLFKRFDNELGVVHTLPLLLIVAAVGVISFLLISSSAPFKGGLFGNLFPKQPSQAALSAIPSPFPNCQPFGGQVPTGQAIPPYNPSTQLGGLEAEPLGPTWCFPLVNEPTTRITSLYWTQ